MAMNRRDLSQPLSFFPCRLCARFSSYLNWLKIPLTHRSHTPVTMSSSYGNPPSASSKWTPSPLIVDLVEYNCAERFTMTTKVHLVGDDLALSAIFATDDPREQLRSGRQVRYFNHDLWQQECEYIVLRGNLVKFSLTDEMRLNLAHTDQRSFAKASPRDSLWGIDLSACYQLASTPDTW